MEDPSGTGRSMEVERRRHGGEGRPVVLEVRAGRLRRLRTSAACHGGDLEAAVFHGNDLAAAAPLGPQPRRLVPDLGGGSSR